MKPRHLVVIVLAVTASMVLTVWPSFFVEDASGAAHSLGHAFFLNPPAPDDEDFASLDIAELAWELLGIWGVAILDALF